jgi:hypothetical protein
MDDKAPPVSVDDEAQKQAEEYLKEERCILEKEREKLAEQQDMAQRKMIQAESLMSKCSREMKEFQAYKVGDVLSRYTFTYFMSIICVPYCTGGRDGEYSADESVCEATQDSR